MLSPQLDTGLKMERIISLLETHGDQLGERMVILELVQSKGMEFVGFK